MQTNRFQSVGGCILTRFLSKTQLSEQIGLSPHTFRRYRERGDWKEGIHFVKLSQNVVLYNERLCLDWVANRTNPIAHERTIRQYLSTLSNEETPTSQKRQRQRKATG